MSNKHVKRYLRQVRICLPCGRRIRNRILNQVYNNLRLYVGEDASVDYDVIVERFGEPQQIASAYIEEMDTPDLLNHLQIRQKIVQSIVVAALVCVMIWLLTAGMVYMKGVSAVTGTIETYIEEVDDMAYGEEE